MSEHDFRQLVSSPIQKSGHILDVVIITNNFPTSLSVSVLDECLSNLYLGVMSKNVNDTFFFKQYQQKLKCINLEYVKSYLRENLLNYENQLSCEHFFSF